MNKHKKGWLVLKSVFLLALLSSLMIGNFSKADSLQQCSAKLEEQQKILEDLAKSADSKGKQIEALRLERDELKEQFLKAEAVQASLMKEIKSLESSLPSMIYLGDFSTTYYCGELYPHICGTGNGITASGAKAVEGVTVAADTTVIPMGCAIYIENVGVRIVQDRGGAIQGNKLDIFVNGHEQALHSPAQNKAKVWLIE